MRVAAQEAVKRADRAAAEAEALRGELAAVQAAVEAGDPAAASAAQQQVRLPGACHVLAPQALTAEPLSLRRAGTGRRVGAGCAPVACGSATSNVVPSD